MTNARDVAGDVVPRSTIEQIVAYRDKSISLYAEAWKAIESADKAIKSAHSMSLNAAPLSTRFASAHEEEIKEFYSVVSLPSQDKFTRVAQKLIDTRVWAHLVEMTGLEALMDKQAKDELRAQMRYIPDRVDPRDKKLITDDSASMGLPPVTIENVYATLQHFAGMSDKIFVRGIANAFVALDRRFRSHDGFKIGSRVILDRAFNENGGWSWGSNKRDTIVDIERVFTILDGKKDGSFTTAIGEIDKSRSGYRPHQSEAETEYFRIRIFKNGNAHLWFARDDLVQKVNQLLASYYGEVLGNKEEYETAEDPLNNFKLTPARRFGFFPTPQAGVKQVIEKLELGVQNLRILEPSAGTGNLARPCLVDKNIVDCCELQGALARDLTDTLLFNRVFCQDFLLLSPLETGIYDRVVMNPPFDRERDIEHVTHAMRFLKPDGLLVSIMSAGTEYRKTKKSVAFRRMMSKRNAVFYDMPIGSFSEVGTYVNTIIVVVWNDGRRQTRSYNSRSFDLTIVD